MNLKQNINENLNIQYSEEIVNNVFNQEKRQVFLINKEKSNTILH